MQELQQYPRPIQKWFHLMRRHNLPSLPVYNSLVFASLLLSQSRHIQQTPEDLYLYCINDKLAFQY